MGKYIVLAIVVLAFFIGTVPVKADTVFNDTSKWIQSWGKGCCTAAKEGTATAPAKAMPMKPIYVKDALGNTVPTQTGDTGKALRGK